jgi:hypothetical protein
MRNGADNARARHLLVMAGLDPAIPDRLLSLNIRMRGSSPRMTEMGRAAGFSQPARP